MGIMHGAGMAQAGGRYTGMWPPAHHLGKEEIKATNKKPEWNWESGEGMACRLWEKKRNTHSNNKRLAQQQAHSPRVTARRGRPSGHPQTVFHCTQQKQKCTKHIAV